MILTNKTVLRDYLAHLQSLIRRMTMLRGEIAVRGAPQPAFDPRMKEMWETLRRDLAKVLDVHLVPFENVANTRHPTGDRDPGQFGRDPTRIQLDALKRKADKARLKDPTISLLKSWVIADHEAEDSDDRNG
jgi:hypothetical protein